MLKCGNSDDDNTHHLPITTVSQMDRATEDAAIVSERRAMLQDKFKVVIAKTWEVASTDVTFLSEIHPFNMFFLKRC